MKEILQEYVGEKKSRTLSGKWWSEEKDIHDHVFQTVRQIEKQQSGQRQEYLKFASLYSSKALSSFTSSQSYTLRSEDRLTLNVVKSCIDTATGKIAKNKVRPMFLTSDGDFSLQKRSKQLTKYIDGVFAVNNVYELTQAVFTDACVYGTGALQVYAEEDEVKMDRVLIQEIIVDNLEGLYKKPRQMHRKRLVTKDTLIALFPEASVEIISSATTAMNKFSSVEMVEVIESWHLPSKKDAKDGRHTICIQNYTLHEEPYSKSFFPFVFLRWTPKLTGFFGEGIAEQLTGIQVEINRTLKSIQQSIAAVAVPRVYLQNNSVVSEDHINNAIGSIIRYTGNPPVFSTATAMNGEVYSYLQNLYDKAYEITGISQLSAQAKNPLGASASGAALDTFNDIESERFVIVGQRLEQYYCDLAEIIVDLSADIYKSNKNLAVKVNGGKFLQTIKWKDVSLKKDQYMIQVFPTNMLPNTPAGRLSAISRLVDGGFIPQEYAKSLLDFPDLEALTSLENAPMEDVKRQLELIIDEGTYQAPEPEQNLALALKLAQSAYLKGKTTDVPEERLALIQRYMRDAKQLLKASEPPPATPASTTNPEPMPPLPPT